MNRETAKNALDKIIQKARVHLYKPIQIAEILFHHRTDSLDLSNIENYRKISKIWRDEITQELIGSRCTSSCKFQDNLFETNAIPPEVLQFRGKENVRTKGAVEAYIYRRVYKKYAILNNIMEYCNSATPSSFELSAFLNFFQSEPGLKRSLDKVYEIIVYALFVTIIDTIELKISISYNKQKKSIAQEFGSFAQKVLGTDLSTPFLSQAAKIFRVGVANAADCGLDMYSNWGLAVQVKHVTLDKQLAKDIVNNVSADRIIIICKNAEQKILTSIIRQIDWMSRIQSIITEEDLIEWYNKALRGSFSSLIGQTLIDTITEEMQNEFPAISQNCDLLNGRGYESISDTFWK